MSNKSILSSSQQFLVRPYVGIDSLKNALDLAQIVIDGERFAAGSVSLPVESLPFDEATIEVFFDPQAIRDGLGLIGLSDKDVRIACIAYGSIVAESKVLVDAPLAELDSPCIAKLSGAPLIFKSPNGFDVRAFLYLAEELDPNELHPYVSGTWLSFREFRVHPYSTLSRFSPTPMDDDLRRYYALPVDSMTYVRVGDDVLQAESLEDDVDVFLDVSILRLLQENPTSALAKYIQLELAVSTLCAILTKIAGMDLGDRIGGIGSLEDTAAWALCEELSRTSGRVSENLLAIAREDPGFLRAIVEAHLKTLRTTSLTLREVT
jgi:hypothetical protein